MRSVDRSALVPYSPVQMFELVHDVDKYPEFLPWCTGSQMVLESPNVQTASVSLGLGALNATFKTRNQLSPPEQISMEFVSGPFSALQGYWKFDQLGDAGCEVSLILQFEFSSRAQDILFGAAFEKVCNELLDAFVARANSLYGNAR